MRKLAITIFVLGLMTACGNNANVETTASDSTTVDTTFVDTYVVDSNAVDTTNIM